jgi:hypothetical protein
MLSASATDLEASHGRIALQLPKLAAVSGVHKGPAICHHAAGPDKDIGKMEKLERQRDQ